MVNLEVGDIIMCTVDRIIGTTVFVKIQGDGEGSIIFSEIAPGRIRNIRDYVVPKKQIICKVLKLGKNQIELSFRRVTQKEQKELKEKYNQERSYKSVFKSVVGEEKARKTIEEIEKTEKFYDFIEEAKTNHKILEKLIGKNETEKILEIISKQKIKTIIVKKEIHLTTIKPNGLELIKKIFEGIKEVEIKYLAAGRYVLQTESEDAKKADNKLRQIIESIEKDAKKAKIEFSIK